MINPKKCARCKGRGWCGKPCLILAKFNLKIKELNSKQNFEGSSPPSVFIGSKLPYPAVNIGILSTPEIKDNVWLYDSPNYWSREGTAINQIVRFRQSLINSRFQTKVSDVRIQSQKTRTLRDMQEIGMAALKADIDIKLKNKPKTQIQLDEHVMPMPVSGALKNMKILSNIKILKSVDKVYFDTDLKSQEALKYLYKKGLDEHQLTQLLSIGISGLKKDRRLVPTRNSITAVDDTLGKQLLANIQDYKEIENYTLYFGGHLGNFYLIMFFPNIFSYELFEMVFPKTTWNPGTHLEYMTDYENFRGRKKYAEETAGGYYAAKFPILEYLTKIKRKASCLVLRFVLPEYNVPLGVWVCRNSVRKSLSSSPEYFPDKQTMLTYTKNLIKKKFNFDITQILQQSKLLEEIKTQIRLTRWF